MKLLRPANLPRPSVTRVLLAVILVGLPVVYLLVIGVAWWRYDEPPDWAPHLWLTAAATAFLGGLALAIVGAIAVGMERWSERVWPHLLQLWGVGPSSKESFTPFSSYSRWTSTTRCTDIRGGSSAPWLSWRSS